MVRQRIEFEKLVRQMDDLKEEMRTRVCLITNTLLISFTCATSCIGMQIENFQSNEVELKSQQRILRDKFTEIKHDAQREIAKMSEDRREVFQQLGRSREEYDYLKAIQSSSVTDYQAQLADLKQVTSIPSLTPRPFTPGPSRASHQEPPPQGPPPP